MIGGRAEGGMRELTDALPGLGRTAWNGAANVQPHGKPKRWNMIYPLVAIFISAA